MDGHWVYGGMERGSGESFLVEVARRDAAALLPIIAHHIRPGTLVNSDEWSVYRQLSATTGNVHHTVNHSLHFVDPITGEPTLGTGIFFQTQYFAPSLVPLKSKLNVKMICETLLSSDKVIGIGFCGNGNPCMR